MQQTIAELALVKTEPLVPTIGFLFSAIVPLPTSEKDVNVTSFSLVSGYFLPLLILCVLLFCRILLFLGSY